MRAVLAWSGLSLVCLAFYAATANVGVAGAIWIAVAHVPLGVGLALSLTGRAATGLAIVLGATLASILASGTAAFAWLQAGDDAVTEAGVGAGVAAGAAACAQFLVAGAAWRARAALDTAQRGGRALLATGLAAPFVFLLAAGAVLRSVDAASATVRAQRASEGTARSALEAILRCAEDHAARHPDRGYPAAQGVFGPAEMGCVGADVAAGRSAEYRFVYLPGVPDASGRISRYAVCARPEDVRRGGVHTLVSDESGRVAAYVPRTAEDFEAGRALPCADVWFLGENDPRRGIEHCLLRWASSHGGYPPSLREIGPLGDACLPPGLDTGLGYAPAAPGQDGVIRDFSLEAPHTLAGP